MTCDPHFRLPRPPPPRQPAGVKESRAGVGAALASYFLWGVLPLFWKALHFLPAAGIVAQRTLWSLLLLLAVLAWRGEGRLLWAGLRDRRTVGWHLLSGALLASNWTLYVWATLNERIVEAALGYYLNPFFNMLFGFWWFGDRHGPWQRAAIALAIAGVAIQLPAAGHFPWVALALAITFALYAVIRKRAPLGALPGLAAETALLTPLALAWLLFTAPSLPDAFGGSWPRALLVIGTGLATAAPLLCFGFAARKIRLTTLGILQFIAPTLQFFIGWQLYGEPVTAARLASFALIWLAIAVYALDAARRPRE
jgi:chloramphenicol-sensitive protein RarD